MPNVYEHGRGRIRESEEEDDEICPGRDAILPARCHVTTHEGWHVQSQPLEPRKAPQRTTGPLARFKSQPDFISKIGSAIEEADESDFWLEFCVGAGAYQAGFGNQASIRGG